MKSAIVVVQHLDSRFVPGLAAWLANETKLPVEVVDGRSPLISDKVHLACTDDHLILARSGHLVYTREPAAHVHRPSVDVFFHSLIKAGRAPGVAVLLTGMGRDGAQGLLALRQAGWTYDRAGSGDQHCVGDAR